MAKPLDDATARRTIDQMARESYEHRQRIGDTTATREGERDKWRKVAESHDRNARGD